MGCFEKTMGIHLAKSPSQLRLCGDFQNALWWGCDLPAAGPVFDVSLVRVPELQNFQRVVLFGPGDFEVVFIF